MARCQLASSLTDDVRIDVLQKYAQSSDGQILQDHCFLIGARRHPEQCLLDCSCSAAFRLILMLSYKSVLMAKTAV